MFTKIIFISLAVCFTVVHSEINVEYAAQIFINQTSDMLYDIANNLTDIAFSHHDLDQSNSTSSEIPDEQHEWFSLIMSQNEFFADAVEVFENYSTEAKKFNYNFFKNNEVKIGIQQIQLVPYEFMRINDVISSNFLTNEKNICSFETKLESECDLLNSTEVKKIISESNNPEELKHYWVEMPKKNQLEMKSYLNRCINFIQDSSEKFNISTSQFFFKDYLDPNFIADMEKVVLELRPFYMELHRYVRTVLIKEYGSHVIPEPNVIPAHLFEKVLADAWNKAGLFKNLVVTDNLVDMKQVLSEKDVTPAKMLMFANNFFQKTEDDGLPNDFWENRVKELKGGHHIELNCHATVWDWSKKPFLKYCPEVDMQKFLQIHGWMARIYYAYQKKDLLFPHFRSYNFEYPVGEAVILSAMTTNYLKSLDLINGTNYDSDHFQMARLLRLGIHTILNIPKYYVHAKIITDLASGKIKLNQVNKHYWYLMEEHAGVISPVPVKGDEISFPLDFYNWIEGNYQTKKFVSEVLGYQFYSSLCKIDELHNTELHRCDFSKNDKALILLKKMMSVGSKKPWREVLSIVTGNTNGMSATPIKRYYSSLFNWLREQNS